SRIERATSVASSWRTTTISATRPISRKPRKVGFMSRKTRTPSQRSRENGRVAAGACRDSGQPAALGCRAHTGWAALVVVAVAIERPEVLVRCRAEIGDPTGHVRRNVYQSARAMDLAKAAALVEDAERIAAEQAAAALERAARSAADQDAVVRSCAVVVGAFSRGVPLESTLRSHALAHTAEGRLYQHALLNGAESCGLDTLAVPKQSIWEEGATALGVP